MDIEGKLGLLYSNVLMEVVSTISGFSLDILSQEWDAEFEEMTGVMSLNGKKSGLLFVSAKEAHMRLLCSYMIGVPQDEVSVGDVEDSLCELVNIIAGGAKLRLSDTDFVFSLSSPFVVRGQNMSVAAQNKSRLISSVLGNEKITVKLTVIY